MQERPDMFPEGAKVVISPDEMRAWVMLPPPAPGVPYTEEGIRAWLTGSGVVYGVKTALVREAVASKKYHELLEVARGDAPVNGTRGDYTLKIEKKPFTGLKGAPDGSLYYDDLSFLQEVEAGTILAEVIPPDPGRPGQTVTGQVVEPKPPEGNRELSGTGFEVTDGGRYYRAPTLSHVSIVGEQLVVTPLLKVETVEGPNPLRFEGNLLVEKDVHPGAEIEATGSVFVVGRAGAATIKAGRNLLLACGMRCSSGFGSVDAKENIWSQCFESAEIAAGGDLCSNHLLGCEAKVGGKALILGGRGAIANSTLYAKEGIVALRIGNERGEHTAVSAGMEAELIQRLEGVDKRIAKLGTDIQSTQQNITAFERMNRTKPDKGRNDPTYKEMCNKRDNALGVLNILNTERQRLKRTMDAFSVVSVIAREAVFPGVSITIDTREHEVKTPLKRVKFRRDGDIIEEVAGQRK